MARNVVEIQADLDAAVAARRTALQAQAYSLDTGQGKQSVQRANLTEINKTIRDLQNELDSATRAADGDTGVTSGRFSRGGW